MYAAALAAFGLLIAYYTGESLASASSMNSLPQLTFSSALDSLWSQSYPRCKSTCPNLACFSLPWSLSMSSISPGPQSQTLHRMSANLLASFQAQTQLWHRVFQLQQLPPALMAKRTLTSPLNPLLASLSGSSVSSTHPSLPQDRR